jgi:hypothetical protein
MSPGWPNPPKRLRNGAATARRANQLRFTRSNQRRCQALRRKIFFFCFPEKYDCLRPSRLHRRGVSRSSRTLEAGSGGRRGAQRACRVDEGMLADAKACGPGPPMPGLSLKVMIFRRRRQSKPGLRGEHVISVNTIAQGMPVVPAALSLLACAKCTSFARKARGCGQHPAFPAPSSFEGDAQRHRSDTSVPRECIVAFRYRFAGFHLPRVVG